MDRFLILTEKEKYREQLFKNYNDSLTTITASITNLLKKAYFPYYCCVTRTKC